MTKFIDKTTTKNSKKKTEFVYFIDKDGNKHKTETKPTEYKQIELLCEYGEFDVMLAIDDGNLFLGHWRNDGC